MSILYQNADLSQSEDCYSNTRHSSAWIKTYFFTAYSTFEKTFQTSQKIGAFLLITHLIKFIHEWKFMKIQADQKSITVMQDTSPT